MKARVTSDATARPGRTVDVEVVTFEGTKEGRKQDRVATEEPLELRLAGGGETKTLAVTMRTPGNDFELAAGFAFGEGIVRARNDIAGINYCIDPQLDRDQRYNVVTIELSQDALPETERFERHFTMSSACGVCGRAQLESLRDMGVAPLTDALHVSAEFIYSLPQRMREAQRVFDATGGLHAAGLFSASGETLVVREDIGRHNAVDKIVGWALLSNRLPLSAYVLMVSGRAGYEILQKSAVARIPIVCCVSAPSSLAVSLARDFNITLVGFLRGNRANVYASSERLTSQDRR